MPKLDINNFQNELNHFDLTDNEKEQLFAELEKIILHFLDKEIYPEM